MSSPENFKPLRGLLLVKRDAPDEERGGIIIPENCKEYGWRATVVRAGPDAEGFSEGDAILFQKEYTILPFEDRTYALTDAKHVIAKLVVEGGIERIMPVNRFVMLEIAGPDDDLDDVVNPNAANHETIIIGNVVKASIDCLDVAGDLLVMLPAGIGIRCVEDDKEFILLAEDEIIAVGQK
jgi:co-chaperonin GroES (HSP10)